MNRPTSRATSLGRIISRSLALAALLGFGGCDSAMAAPLRVVGSDALGPAVVELLQQRARNDGTVLTIEFSGSAPARDALIAGRADLAVVADDPQAEAWPAEYVAVPLAYFTAVVVVPEAVMVDQLDFTGLTRVFGAASAVANTYWSDFGVRGVASALPVAPHLLQPSVGLATVLFAHVVLRDGAVKADVQMHATAAEILKTVATSDGGIAIVPWLPDSMSGLRTVPVAVAPGQVAFSPTDQNLHAGDYPLRWPLRLVVARTEAARLLPWLQVWFSDEMSAALLASDLVPLPTAARTQEGLDLELIR